MICHRSGTAAGFADDEHLAASAEDLHFFLCDALGFGREEVSNFIQRVDLDGNGQIDFEEFQRGYSLLNSHRICRRVHENFLRKPGSINGQQFALEELRGCEVHVLDHVGGCLIDGCCSCEVIIGPSDSSVFVRDCEDCTFYIVAQQLRTRRCTRCVFHLYSATEPVIEASLGLCVAPISLAYPNLAAQMHLAKLDPQRNLWNAIFDFSSPNDSRKNWALAQIGECQQYRILLDGQSGDDPKRGALISDADATTFPTVTSAMLNADPLAGGDVGTRLDDESNVLQ